MIIRITIKMKICITETRETRATHICIIPIYFNFEIENSTLQRIKFDVVSGRRIRDQCWCVCVGHQPKMHELNVCAALGGREIFVYVNRSRFTFQTSKVLSLFLDEALVNRQFLFSQQVLFFYVFVFGVIEMQIIAIVIVR